MAGIPSIESFQTIDSHRLNDARWAACNARGVWAEHIDMEQVTAVADNIVREYLGLSPEEWDELPKELEQ